MRHLAHTDPDEYEKLNRLLSMSSAECDQWLTAADMPFTTTSKEARVAEILGIMSYEALSY
jgi:hypothetical protein